jgi:hypothetical protein
MEVSLIGCDVVNARVQPVANVCVDATHVTVAAGLARRQRRSTAYSNRAEPKAARQASLSCPARPESCLPSIDTREWEGERKQESGSPSSAIETGTEWNSNDRL